MMDAPASWIWAVPGRRAAKPPARVASGPRGRSTPLRLGQGKAVPGRGLALVPGSSIRSAACVPPPGSGRPVGSKQRMRRPGLRRWPVVPPQAAPPDQRSAIALDNTVNGTLSG
jgi:hypothetical protein